jgi:ribosome-associated protein
MSKKHPGVNVWWREHLQGGRKKKAGADVQAEPVVDARKPPGWRGKKATREAASVEKAMSAGKAAAGEEQKFISTGLVSGKKTAPTAKFAPGAKHGPKNKHGAKGAPGKKHGPKSKAQKFSSSAVKSAPAAESKVTLDGEGRPYITLVQFLKTLSLVGTGGAGKHAIRAGGILVNGVEDLRPGRKLHAGDVVTIGDEKHSVTL